MINTSLSVHISDGIVRCVTLQRLLAPKKHRGQIRRRMLSQNQDVILCRGLGHQGAHSTFMRCGRATSRRAGFLVVPARREPRPPDRDLARNPAGGYVFLSPMSTSLRAVLFDFDGVIVNSEPLHFYAFHEVLKSEQIELTEEEYYREMIGFDDKGAFRHIYKRRGLALEPKTFLRLLTRQERSHDGADPSSESMPPSPARRNSSAPSGAIIRWPSAPARYARRSR